MSTSSVYLPRHFSVADEALLLDFMVAHPFAQLIGCDDRGQPFISHVPVATRREGETLLIEGHLALGNPQGAWLAAGRGMVVFTGPHSYVSPSLYGSAPAVPTWNYTAVHARGAVVLVQAPEEKDALLKGLIAHHEPAYADTWRDFDPAYKERMLKGIVGFRLTVDSLEGKFKLSQNRSAEDRQRVYQAHAAGTGEQQALAGWMQRLGLVD